MTDVERKRAEAEDRAWRRKRIVAAEKERGGPFKRPRPRMVSGGLASPK